MSVLVQALVLGTLTGVMVLICNLSITGFYTPLVFGVLTGLIVGNPSMGLQVGATCTLMALGFYTYGGATTPDYNVGSMFGVVVAVQTGDVTQGIVIGSIIALLMSWFDILGRATTTVFQHLGDKALANRKLHSFERWHMMGVIPWFLGRFIPVFVGMLFIDKYMYISNFIERYSWIKGGMSVVGASLPAVGFALLLSYMDIKHYWPFMLIGYVLFAYMGVPTLGLAIFGVALAALFTTFLKGRRNE